MKVPGTQIKVQVDRWPTIERPRKGIWPHLLSIIIVGMFTGQPTKEEMIQAMESAIAILRG